MAHGITEKDSMLYVQSQGVRDLPWHINQTREQVRLREERPTTTREALVTAGLEWPVFQVETFRPVTGEKLVETSDGYFMGVFKKEPEFRFNVREDTDDALGVVTEGYTPFQNSDAFAFLDEIIGSGAHFETAGSLFGGKRIWVLVRIPEYVEVGGDEHARYIYVANSHDGTLAVTASATAVRILCANTLGMALGRSDRSGNSFKIRHTGNVRSRVYDAREVMKLEVDYESRFKELGDKLAQERFTPLQFDKILRRDLFPIEDDMGKRARANRDRTRECILDLYKGRGEDGDTTGNSPRSKWAAWNAVCEFADWKRRYTKRTSQIVRSFEDTDLKERSLEAISAA